MASALVGGAMLIGESLTRGGAGVGEFALLLGLCAAGLGLYGALAWMMGLLKLEALRKRSPERPPASALASPGAFRA